MLRKCSLYHDPAIVQVAQNAELVADEHIAKLYPARFPAKATVVLKDSRKFTSAVEGPTGSTENPMSFQDVRKKFMQLSEPVCGGEVTQSILDP